MRSTARDIRAQIGHDVPGVKGIECAFVRGVEGGAEGEEERGYRTAYGAGVGDVDDMVVGGEGDAVGLVEKGGEGGVIEGKVGLKYRLR